jgi:hypothetical protein
VDGTFVSTTGTSGQRPLAQRGWRIRHSLWILFPALSFGLLTSVGFVIVGARASRRAWWGAGVGYFVLAVVALTIPGAGGPGSVLEGVGSALLFVLWLGGVGHAFLINPSWLRWRAGREDEIANRHTPQLAPASTASWTQGGPPPMTSWAAGPPAATQPRGPQGAYGAQRAHEAPWDGPPQAAYGSAPPPVSRPGSQPLDVNTAGIGELAGLPGFDYERAGRVVTTRGRQNGFGAVEDFHRAAALAPHEIALVRDHVCCSPPRFGSSPYGAPRPGSPPPGSPRSGSPRLGSGDEGSGPAGRAIDT